MGYPTIYNVVREMTFKLRLKEKGGVGNLGSGNSRNKHGDRGQEVGVCKELSVFSLLLTQL